MHTTLKPTQAEFWDFSWDEMVRTLPPPPPHLPATWTHRHLVQGHQQPPLGGTWGSHVAYTTDGACARNRRNSTDRRKMFAVGRSFSVRIASSQAAHDLPATIDHVLNATNETSLFYVGHSQGTTLGFVAFSDPAIAAKVPFSFRQCLSVARQRWAGGIQGPA